MQTSLAVDTLPAPACASIDPALVSSMSTSSATTVQPLTAIHGGRCMCVAVEGNSHSQIRLKRMGICPGRIISVVQAGDPMVLSVIGAQLGVSRMLAACVLVRPIAVESGGVG